MILALAWRSESWTTFTSAPLDLSSVAYVRLKVCQPISFVIPSVVAAGLTLRFNTYPASRVSDRRRLGWRKPNPLAD